MNMASSPAPLVRSEPWRRPETPPLRQSASTPAAAAAPLPMHCDAVRHVELLRQRTERPMPAPFRPAERLAFQATGWNGAITLRPISGAGPRAAALLAGDVDLTEAPPVQEGDRGQPAQGLWQRGRAAARYPHGLRRTTGPHAAGGAGPWRLGEYVSVEMIEMMAMTGIDPLPRQPCMLIIQGSLLAKGRERQEARLQVREAS